ncbi:transposase [Sedimentitalea sp. XS_ASV28]|uniref:transposase n=1 Tax=Sedimentitalea sp. XS_ASV28 TaxID=3241296 RepID=UPI00351339A6
MGAARGSSGDGRAVWLLGTQTFIAGLIPGLGPVVTAAILAFLPEIGTLARKQAGSLAGLVPHSRESGQWKGKSFIRGGRKPLRDALYMPALVVMRFNQDLKAKYIALRDAGKPAKVALVALMRKLIETANALAKADRFWIENRSSAWRILRRCCARISTYMFDTIAEVCDLYSPDEYWKFFKAAGYVSG